MYTFNSQLLVFSILITLAQCGPKNENMSITTIQNWKEWLAKNKAEVLQLFKDSDKEIEENVGYEKLKPLDAMFDPGIHPATFYFSGDKVVLIYIREQNALNKINPKDLTAAWGHGFEMNSRAGEEMTHIVYPKQGVAFTLEEGRIRFLEIFTPMTLEKYKDTIYEDPGTFIK